MSAEQDPAAALARPGTDVGRTEAAAASREALVAAKAELEHRVIEQAAQLRRANERLRDEIARCEATQAALFQSQKLEAIGQLTSGIAHDFNNIIAAISGGFALIERRTSDPQLLELVHHGARAAERGAALVKRLGALAPCAVDLRALLDEARALIRRSVGVGVELEIDCEAGLRPVLVDPIQLETSLINLAVNARDAMPDGGKLVMTACACPAGAPGRPPELGGFPAVAIEVRDTGCGMGPDVLQRATELFFTTKASGKGTGLGLAMVHDFARRTGGALRIESRIGHGTAVTLYLPHADAVEQRDERAPADAMVETETPVRATILLADDDDEVRSVIAAQLRDLGHTVIEVSDAAALLAEAESPWSFDAVISDVLMPGMNGPALAAALRRVRPGLPILFVTGHADSEHLAGEAVLGKPFTMRSLATAVQALLGSCPAWAGG